MNDSNLVSFSGDCGEATSGYNSATNNDGMQVDQSALVNENPVQNCIVANDGGAVFSISLNTAPTTSYGDYQIVIDAQGPSGFTSGSMYLAFKDKTGDVYYISITVASRHIHTLGYESSSPDIVAIYWSDNSFTVDGSDSNAEKPKYQVISPVIS